MKLLPIPSIPRTVISNPLCGNLLYLIYIDESGTPSSNHWSPYVLTAFIVHENGWKGFLNKINQLKEDYLPQEDKQSVELHTNVIVMGLDDFQDLSWDKRMEILSRLSNIIKKNGCRIISTIINKQEITAENKDDFIKEWSWKLLLERIEIFLSKKNNKEKTNYGIICMDSIGDEQNQDILEGYKRFVKTGTFFQKSNYLLEDIFFVDSELRPMMQLADFAAWVTRRWYIINHKGTETEFTQFNLELFDTIRTRYDANAAGEIIGSGIKIFPK